MRNVLEYLEAAYLKEPEKTAYASETDSLTFRQVYMQARSVGTVLLKDGLYKKPVVVFMEKKPADDYCIFRCGLCGVLLCAG